MLSVFVVVSVELRDGGLAFAKGANPGKRGSDTYVNIWVPVKAIKAGVRVEEVPSLRGPPDDVRPGPGQRDSTIFGENARKYVEKFVEKCGKVLRRTVWDIHPRG